jgi:ATP-binding cassette subfamily B protein
MRTGLGHPIRTARRWRTAWASSWSALRTSLIWRRLGRQKWWVRLLVLLLFVYFGAQTLIALRMVDMVNSGIVHHTHPLGTFLVQLVVLSVVSLLGDFGARQVLSRISWQLEFDLRVSLYDAIQSAELRRLDAVATGQLVTRSLTEIQLLQQILLSLSQLVTFLPLVPIAVVIVLVLSPPMAALTAAALPINIWLVRRFRKRLWGLSWAELNERAEVTRAIDEPVRGIRVVKAFGREEYERERVRSATDRTYRYSMSRARLLARYDIPLQFVPNAFMAVVLLIGSHLAVAGTVSIGVFLLSFQAVNLVAQVAASLNDLGSWWQYLRSSQYRLGQVLALAQEGVLPSQPLPARSTGLEVDGVDLSLGGRRVLSGVDLSVSYGELVVLSGGPSTGKTTVASLAAGMLVPDSGTVTLDGVPVGDLDPSAARQAIRVVSEDPFLFATTIRENLELGAAAAVGDESLTRAVWAAGAEDVVAELPDGLDSHIGDRGLTLSGGQRQRLSLARALVHPPRVLVLDDALAAVNPSFELDIIGRIRSHAPGTAVLCITRRPRLAAAADRAFTLDRTGDGPGVSVVPDTVVPEPMGFAPLSVELEGVVANLRLTDQPPSVPAEMLTRRSRPRVRSLLRALRWVVLAGWVVLLLNSASQLLPSLLFGSVSDLAKAHKTGQINLRALAMVGIAIGAGVTQFGYRILTARFAQSFVYSLRRAVFQALSRLGIDFYDRELPGDVAARVVNDLDTTLLFMQTQAFKILNAAATFLVAMAIMIALSPRIVPLALVLLGATLAITLVQAPLSESFFAKARHQLGRVVAKFEEDYAGRREIQSYGAHRTQQAKFVAASDRLRRLRRWSLGISNGYGALLNFFSYLTATLVLWRAGQLALAGTISVGTALALRLVAQTGTQPIADVGTVLPQFLNLRVSWRRLCEPFDAPILPTEDPAPLRCPTLKGRVRFENVSFSYPHVGRPVLHDVSFDIPAGTLAALVGYTGAGKSSVAKLLSRTYDPDSGVVSVDGNDLRRLELAGYRRRVGIVPQDAFVFRGTVASNIAYGVDDATLRRIMAAARAVGAHEILSDLPGGYDHPVEEEGRNLTAAQRQLIACARAWLYRPDFLVLDEATSTLDAILEEQVISAISRLGCTTLMVTHRRQVVDRADLVIVLEGGRVAEVGSPAGLAASRGAFDRLWAPDAVDAVVLSG